MCLWSGDWKLSTEVADCGRSSDVRFFLVLATCFGDETGRKLSNKLGNDLNSFESIAFELGTYSVSVYSSYVNSGFRLKSFHRVPRCLQ